MEDYDDLGPLRWPDWALIAGAAVFCAVVLAWAWRAGG